MLPCRTEIERAAPDPRRRRPGARLRWRQRGSHHWSFLPASARGDQRREKRSSEAIPRPHISDASGVIVRPLRRFRAVHPPDKAFQLVRCIDCVVERLPDALNVLLATAFRVTDDGGRFSGFGSNRLSSTYNRAHPHRSILDRPRDCAPRRVASSGAGQCSVGGSSGSRANHGAHPGRDRFATP